MAIATRDPFAVETGEVVLLRAERDAAERIALGLRNRAETAERDLAAERERLKAAQAEIDAMKARLDAQAGRAVLGIPEGRR